jgi:starch-binding outer membrane protein SusE/F
MKKIAIIFTVILTAFFFNACEDDRDLTVLDLSETQNPAITNPTDGQSIILLQDDADEAFIVEWTPANYTLDNVPEVRYFLQMDMAGNDFASPVDLINTTGTMFETTVASFNQRLVGMGLESGAPAELEFRVFSFLTLASETTYAYSEVINLSVTPYEDFLYVKPIYMLGNGTPAGWDNNLAIEMYHIEDGMFALVERLGDGGNMVKFISMLGAWAPQWGAEAGGTAEAGQLAYRPTEDDPDPEPIDITDLEPGDYRVLADTANMTYHISKATEVLYLLGSATTAGWDNEAALEMTKDAPGMFSIVTNLTAGEDMYIKFIEVPGQWAPQYGTDENGTWESGNLIFRPTKSKPDPANIPAPNETGSYLIEVNLSNRTYQLTAQ